VHTRGVLGHGEFPESFGVSRLLELVKPPNSGVPIPGGSKTPKFDVFGQNPKKTLPDHVSGGVTKTAKFHLLEHFPSGRG
jgi:hypothetical protein